MLRPLLVNSLASAVEVQDSLPIAATRTAWSLVSNDSKIVLTLQDNFLACGSIPSSIVFPFIPYQV
jgi:hypothetical protein